MTRPREQTDDRNRAATQACLRLAAIVESSEDAIIGKDMNGIIWDWNSAAKRLYGYSPDEVIGKPISILSPPDRADELVEIMTKVRAGETIKHFETVRRKKDGTLIEVSLTVSPILDPGAQVIGAATIVRDITESRHQEAALRESEERLRMATQAGKMFAYEWDAATDKIVHSEGGTQILGEAEGTHITGQHILSMLPPEDRERLIAAGTRMSPEKPYLQIRHRIVRPDGSVIWVDESSRAYFDEHGMMLKIVGMVADVTDRVRAEEAMADMSRKLLEAQEQEGARIARELHDDVNQRLALLAVSLDAMTAHPATELRQELRKASTQIRDLGSDVQGIAHRLHSPKLDLLGLAPAAAGFCREVAHRNGVEVEFHSENIPKHLPQAVLLCLYRVLQEALQNAIKHSGSRHFQALLRAGASDIELTVHDSGRGFEPEKAIKGRGLGLTSMNERLKLVGGQLSVDTKPGRGTTIHARVPLSSGLKVAVAGG